VCVSVGLFGSLSLSVCVSPWIYLCVSLSVSVSGSNPLVFLPGESQGQGSLVGCRLWGRTESDTTEAT